MKDTKQKTAKFYALEQKRKAIARGAHERIRGEVLRALVECDMDINAAARKSGRTIKTVEEIAKTETLLEMAGALKKSVVSTIVDKMWAEGVEGDSFQDRKMLLEMFAPELADAGVRRQRVANQGLKEKEIVRKVLPPTAGEMQRLIARIDPIMSIDVSDRKLEVSSLDDD